MQNNNISKEQLSMLLNSVAKKMGKTPEQLEHDLKNGNYPTDTVKDFMDTHDIGDVLNSRSVQNLFNGNDKKK